MNRSEAIEAKISQMISGVHDQLAKDFESETQKLLDKWKKRFPRHNFSAQEGNGSLVFYCKPALKGSEHLDGMFDYISAYHVRGAIKEMLDEAEEFKDWYISLEWKIGATFNSGFEIKSS